MLPQQQQFPPATNGVADAPTADSAGYDDTQDHDQCSDCKGSGWYVGFWERSHCQTCDGSGWL